MHKLDEWNIQIKNKAGRPLKKKPNYMIPLEESKSDSTSLFLILRREITKNSDEDDIPLFELKKTLFE